MYVDKPPDKNKYFPFVHKPNCSLPSGKFFVGYLKYEKSLISPCLLNLVKESCSKLQ